MKKHKVAIAYGVWIVFYIVAVLLSLLNEPNLWIRICSVLFFVPGMVLAFWAAKEKDRKQIKRLRIICITSLVLTTVMLVVSFLTVNAAPQTTRIINSIFIIVSEPLWISPSWVLSMFLWACILMITIPGMLFPGEKKPKKKKKKK